MQALAFGLIPCCELRPVCLVIPLSLLVVAVVSPMFLDIFVVRVSTVVMGFPVEEQQNSYKPLLCGLCFPPLPCTLPWIA